MESVKAIVGRAKVRWISIDDDCAIEFCQERSEWILFKGKNHYFICDEHATYVQE